MSVIEADGARRRSDGDPDPHETAGAGERLSEDAAPRPVDDVPRPSFGRALEAKAARKLKAREEGDRGVWFGLGMMGLVGWSVAIPTVVGVAIGLWVDSRYEAPGSVSWTITGLVLGVALGCLNAWLWIQKELDDR